MKRVLLTTLLFIASTSLTFSFDGNRKGFILGFGMGGGMSSFTQTISFDGWGSSTSDPENQGNLATDFLIGYTPSNQLEIFYSNKVNWLSMTNALGNDIVITSAVTGIGINYHLVGDTWEPHLFFNGSVGFSSWTAPFEDGSTPWTGFGGTIGIGYEVA